MHKAEALTETREGRPRVTQVEKNVRPAAGPHLCACSAVLVYLSAHTLYKYFLPPAWDVPTDYFTYLCNLYGNAT